MAKKLVKLTEEELTRLVKKVIKEQNTTEVKGCDQVITKIREMINPGNKGQISPVSGKNWTVGAVGSANVYIRLTNEDGSQLTFTL